jgi:parvulin-like peptidyl-prolyl isomerase
MAEITTGQGATTVQASPTFMKPQGSLTLAVSLVLAASAAIAADPAKSNPAPAAPATPAAPAAAPLPDPVAVVEGNPIKKAELEAAFANVVAAQKIPIDSLPPEQRAMGYRMILDEMIIDKLLIKRSAETTVPEEEVAAQFERIKANFGTEEELKKQLDAAGQTVDKVKVGLRERMRQERWINEQIKGKDAVSDADIEDFYKKNPEQFQVPEQVRASHILVKVEQDAKPEVVAEKEKAAQAIAARVKKGEAFDKLAKEISEDPSAKENSGDLDFFTKEAMVPEFSNKAFSMKKDEISDPVRSQFGYHVIKLTDRKAAETVTLEKAKPQLLAYLQRQKKQTEVEKIVKDIRAKAEVKVNLPAAPAPAPVIPPAP